MFGRSGVRRQQTLFGAGRAPFVVYLIAVERYSHAHGLAGAAVNRTCQNDKIVLRKKSVVLAHKSVVFGLAVRRIRTPAGLRDMHRVRRDEEGIRDLHGRGIGAAILSRIKRIPAGHGVGTGVRRLPHTDEIMHILVVIGDHALLLEPCLPFGAFLCRHRVQIGHSVLRLIDDLLPEDALRRTFRKHLVQIRIPAVVHALADAVNAVCRTGRAVGILEIDSLLKACRHP